MSNVTRILRQIESGQCESVDELLSAVYDELRQMAARQMARELPGQTLDATGLVHEAWLRLGPDPSFESRRHFFGAAAQAMRRILIERARARRTQKRGARRGNWPSISTGWNRQPEPMIACKRWMRRFRGSNNGIRKKRNWSNSAISLV